MRKIKFRAWDTLNNVIYTNPFDGKIGGMNDIFSNAGNWIYMQCVGLKDKNGVEIYEGDIVTYNINGTNKKRWRNKILWKNGCLIIENEDVPPIMDDNIYNIEILGNIYENPEMLEEKKMKKSQKFYGKVKYRDWDDKIFFLQNSLAVAHLLEPKAKSKGFCFFEVFDSEDEAHSVYPDMEIETIILEEDDEPK